MESNQLFLKALIKKKHTTQTFNFVDSAPENTDVCKGLYLELNPDTKFIYEGYFLKGEPNGLGRMLFGSGNVYRGMFSDGLPHGDGILDFDNGDRYIGQFRHGILEGHGTLHYK